MIEWIIARSGSPNPAITAAKLLNEFGSLSAVIAAGSPRLKTASGDDSAAVEAVEAFNAVMQHALREKVAARPIMGNWSTLLSHLRSEMAFSPIEHFRVLHLDARNGLIRDELTSVGTIDTAPVYIREVIRRALDLGAASLVLAHNHPSGDPSPSSADIALTKHLTRAARLFDITIHDHLIVTAQAHVSMRAEGHIQ